MPHTARIVGVMIGSPSDAQEERQAIVDALLCWNASHGRERQLFLEPIRWETHTTPGLLGHPQEMVNKDLIPISDLLIAVFRVRIGSPTRKHVSGTIEEIREFMAAKKYVAVYFFEGKASLGNLDPEQLAEVRRFKEEIQSQGLVGSYQDAGELRTYVTQHLPSILNRLRPETILPPDVDAWLRLFLFPELVVKHAVTEFQKWLGNFDLDHLPQFQCDAQVTVVTEQGIIERHLRPSSIGERVSIHGGDILWSDLAFTERDRPLQVVLQATDSGGWIAWTDSGYSNLHTAITPRNNHRVCLGFFERVDNHIAILEIHQELAFEIPRRAYFPHFSFPFSLNFRGEHKPSVAGVS